MALLSRFLPHLEVRGTGRGLGFEHGDLHCTGAGLRPLGRNRPPGDSGSDVHKRGRASWASSGNFHLGLGEE